MLRIGGKTEKHLDIRVIAATNRNLYHEVQEKSFRGDLYFRINVVNKVIFADPTNVKAKNLCADAVNAMSLDMILDFIEGLVSDRPM